MMYVDDLSDALCAMEEPARHRRRRVLVSHLGALLTRGATAPAPASYSLSTPSP